jgi:hypothetical protein
VKRISLMATLVAVAAVWVMSIGAGSASAGILCHTWEPYNYKCPIADRYQVGEELQGVNLGEVKLTDKFGFPAFACKESKYNQVIKYNGASGSLEPTVNTNKTLTFGNCTGWGGKDPKPVVSNLGETRIGYQFNTLDGPIRTENLKVKTWVGTMERECEYLLAGGEGGTTDSEAQSLKFVKAKSTPTESICPEMYFTATYHVAKPFWVEYK